MSRNPSVIILTAHKRFACFILHSAAHFSFSLLRKIFENLNISEIVYYKSCQNISERMFQQLFSCCKCDDEGILHMRKIEISRFHQMSTHFELMSECVSNHNLIWTAENCGAHNFLWSISRMSWWKRISLDFNWCWSRCMLLIIWKELGNAWHEKLFIIKHLKHLMLLCVFFSSQLNKYQTELHGIAVSLNIYLTVSWLRVSRSFVAKGLMSTSQFSIILHAQSDNGNALSNSERNWVYNEWEFENLSHSAVIIPSSQFNLINRDRVNGLSLWLTWQKCERFFFISFIRQREFRTRKIYVGHCDNQNRVDVKYVKSEK